MLESFPLLRCGSCQLPQSTARSAHDLFSLLFIYSNNCCYKTDIIVHDILIVAVGWEIELFNIHRNDATTNDDENVKTLLITTLRQPIFNTSPVSFNRRLTPRSWIFNAIFCIVLIVAKRKRRNGYDAGANLNRRHHEVSFVHATVIISMIVRVANTAAKTRHRIITYETAKNVKRTRP